jgi:hypothetical protein
MACICYEFLNGHADGISAGIATIGCLSLLLSALLLQKSNVARLTFQVLLVFIFLQCISVFILGDAVTYTTITSSLFFLCASTVSFFVVAKNNRRRILGNPDSAEFQGRSSN